MSLACPHGGTGKGSGGKSGAHRASLSVSSTTSTEGSLGRKVYAQKDMWRGVCQRCCSPPVLLLYCRSRSTMLTASHKCMQCGEEELVFLRRS